MKKNRVVFVSLVMVLCFAGFVLAADLSLDDLIKNVQANQTKIKDMYAETTTTINSNITIPGMQNKGPQKMVQKTKIWSKGEDKQKMEIDSPAHQISITNGDKMAIINPDTGQKMVQDLKKMRQQSGLSDSSNKAMSLEKVKQMFDMKVTRQGADYLLSGIPKKADKLIGKIEFYIDTDKWAPDKVLIYNTKGGLMSQSDVEYQKISDIWVPVKNRTKISGPSGKMDIDVQFSNIRINKGIADSVFKID